MSRLLTEPEGYALLAGAGLRVPRHFLVPEGEALDPAALAALPGERVVVKVVSPEIGHKSELGGVRIAPREEGAVAAVISEMEARLAGREVHGWLVAEFVEHGSGPADQLLLGARWTEDFGPVVTLGPGGVEAEFWAAQLPAGRDLVLLSAEQEADDVVDAALRAAAATRLATSPWRGRPPRFDPVALRRTVQAFQALVREAAARGITELEVNPLVPAADGPVALDVYARLGEPPQAPAPGRPRAGIRRLLEPRSIAVVGVSERPNPGHIIVRNTLAAGFDPRRLWIVKPGCGQLLGCTCVPDLASLPEPVDLLVLAVAAPQVPELVEEVVAQRRAESLVVIPGGLGEHSESGPLADRVRRALAASRGTGWGGPVLNGANCLGIRSRPGHYDTLFIPRHKLPAPAGPESPLAVLSQSGAFAVARASKLARLNPRYLVTAGNQLDLTLADYLEEMAEDDGVRVFACYVEGFQPGDGARFLAAARRIVASGRTVVLYRAGRTPAGASASASHTASVAGDYAVTRELCRREGVVVAESLDDFDDLVQLLVAFADRPLRGRRLGALSNAGFECVAMADNLHGFALADLADDTRAGLDELLAASRLEGIVEVRQPLDVTPMMGDEPFVHAAARLLAAPEVDLALVGCVPLTAAMNTLAAGDHPEDLTRSGSVARELAALWRGSTKPWCVVVDSGEAFDPLAGFLLDAGVPTFRSADRALRALDAAAPALVRAGARISRAASAPARG